MEKKMETRVAVIAIIIEDGSSAQEVNELLHGAAKYIIGRMGIPYRDKGISIISIAIDAPPGYHQYVVRQNRPAERCILSKRRIPILFQKRIRTAVYTKVLNSK